MTVCRFGEYEGCTTVSADAGISSFEGSLSVIVGSLSIIEGSVSAIGDSGSVWLEVCNLRVMTFAIRGFSELT